MSFDNGLIDLRSDTVTHPTPAMRQAMSRAAVGDDVFDDDPSVHALQERAAALVGHAAALFMPSGTMANLTALLTHGGRGHEIIVGDKSHIYLNEGGGMAALGGMQAGVVRNQPDGTLALADIEAAIRVEDVHHPRTRLICLENTHNGCGGVPITPAYTRQVMALARAHGLAVHVDGARLFNAAVALHVPPAELAAPADSVMFCLSKGLSAPIGSMLCGSVSFIREARRWRKTLGGGMRQVGVLAAAGLLALTEMLDRLPEDHHHARQLAEGLHGLAGLELEPGTPHTNMVYFRLTGAAPVPPAALIEHAHQHGVLLEADGARFRLVTHAWVSAADVVKTTAVIRQVWH